jgi:hypothetical protein
MEPTADTKTAPESEKPDFCPPSEAPPHPTRIRIGVRCRGCYGAGKLSDDAFGPWDCPVCDGSGVL